MQQFDLDFDGGLTDRFPDFRECIQASVHGCGRQMKAVAADLDMSPSELTRKLSHNPNDPVHFPVCRLPDLIKATGDLSPIYWLVERFCEDADAKRNKNIDRLAKLLPEIEKLVKGAA